MCIELYDDANAKISDLTDNSRPLGFYSPLDGYAEFTSLIVCMAVGSLSLLLKVASLIKAVGSNGSHS